MAGERIYIKQEFIPGFPGKLGFTSADDALRWATWLLKESVRISLPRADYSPGILDRMCDESYAKA